MLDLGSQRGLTVKARGKRRTVSSRGLIAGFTALMALLTAAYFWLGQPFIWTGIGVLSAAAVAVGAIRNKPRRRAPWLMLSAGLLAFSAADTTYYYLSVVSGADLPFPSWADVIYLAVYSPLTAAAFFGLARSGAASRDRASRLDAFALTLSLGMLSWLFLINPYVRAEQLTTAEKAISLTYPLFDVLILVILIRVALDRPVMPVTVLLTTGTVFALVSDAAYGLIQLNDGWVIGRPLDLGWVVWFVAWGAAALHPSMVELTEPRALRRPGSRPWRLLPLAVASLIAPVVLLIEHLAGIHRNVGVATVVSIAMFLVVLARLYAAINEYRGAVGRERVLREAGARLVSATNIEDVDVALREAVGHLLPAGIRHHVLMVMGDLAAGSGPSLPQEAGVRHTRLVYTATLDPQVRQTIGDLEIAAQCRLVLGNRRSGDPHIGTVYVAADESLLMNLQEALEVLAAQAALALDRIWLSTEISQRDSEEYFRTLVQNTADVILILTSDDRIRYASPSAAALFGDGSPDQTADRFRGMWLYDLVQPQNRDSVTNTLNRIRGGQQPGPADWVVSSGRGPLQVEATCRDLRGERTVGGLVVTLRDVTEQRRLEAELRHRAFHDALTGLANRALFNDRVTQSMNRAARDGTIVGVLFVDLDDFKVVNDTLGHAAGDDLLVAVSRRLAEVVRPGDTVARLGGDEFATLVEGVHQALGVEDVAQRIITAFAEPFAIGGSLISGMVSVGIATTVEAKDPEDLIRQADLALYVAKDAGKGQWRRYQAALHSAVLQRLELRTELDQALATQAFCLEYQPIVALDTGKPAGMEALIRWKHPTRGLLPPSQFIDVAEESGLVIPIGAWVLERALADAASWRSQMVGCGHIPYVSINVSTRQFRDPSFLTSVRQQLTAAGLPPHMLVLEITESLLLRDDDQVTAELNGLRNLGVRIAIDDFGTGYSSLSYLQRVPADFLKIERSFIGTVSASPKQRALVKGILQLARTLQLTVVAEAIEHDTERELLANIGCQYGQGYLFSKPLGYLDAVKWLLGAQAS